MDGPLLFVDTAATAVHAPTDLLEFIAAKKHTRKERLTLDNLKSAEKNLMTTDGNKKPRIRSSHSARLYKMHGFDDVPLSEATFFDDEKKAEP